MVALDLDIPILDGATGAAQLLELLRQRAQFFTACHDSSNDGDGLTTAPFAIPHHAHDTVALFRWLNWLVAAAVFIWLPAGGAGGYPSAIGGIDYTIRHTILS